MSSDITTNQNSQSTPASYTAVKKTVENKPVEMRQEASVEEGNILPPEDDSINITDKELQIAVSNLNKYVQQIGRDLLFSIDESSESVVVKVLNTETEEVVRQIPTKEALRLSRNLQNLQNGGNGLIFETSA